MKAKIENILLSNLNPAEYEYGFARLDNLLSDIYHEYKYGISIMKVLPDEIVNEISDGPTIAYYNQYNKINNELNEKIRIITHELKRNGIKALGIKSTVKDNALTEEYYQTLRYNLSHKMVATRAGLGWIGKTDLFISNTHGPRVRLSSILLDTEVVPKSKPIDYSLCGDCSICVDACPAKAANGQLWNINIDRNEFYDPFKCREYCRKISKIKLNKDISLCGKCILVCPKGIKH